MSSAQRAILIASNVFLLAALVGLLVRGRLRLVYSFPFYLLAVVVLSSLSGLWPERFHTWSFYWFKQSVYGVLEVAIALELTTRVFQTFPAARRTARIVFLVVLVVTFIAAWTAPVNTPAGARTQGEWAQLVVLLHPRIANGTAWLFGALFALILYYRLPLHHLHKAVAFGFMANLLFLTFGLDQLRRSQFTNVRLMSYMGSLAYTAVTAYWAWAAWRRDDPPPVDPEVVQRIQPWR